MSAIVGVWHADGRPGASARSMRMLKAVSQYGPHAVNSADQGEIALGKRLFRSLPEDLYDDGPVTGGDDRWMMVADLRLDNREELADQLDLQGPWLSTHSDSSLAMAAWERWQEGCFDRLAGDFAIAVWDRHKRHLILARDILGMRPLYFHRAKALTAFASMAKGLHALPEIPYAADMSRIEDELALLPDQGSRSFFAGIERVKPGHFVVLAPDTARSHRYWSPKRTTLRLPSPQAYAEALREQLDRAVSARLRGAGAAVGAHLSAGFDSSVVATSAAAQLASRNAKLIAFTAAPRAGYAAPVPRNRVGDEAPLAAKTAALFPNIEHVVLRNDAGSPVANLDRHFHLYERPILNLCNKVWSDSINDAAHERRLTVMLTGQMGNMTISYDGLALLPQLIRRGHWLRWLHEGRALMRQTTMRPRGLLALSLGPCLPSSVWSLLSRRLRGERVDLESYSMLAARPDRPTLVERAHQLGLDLNQRPRRDGFETRLWALGRVDQGNYLKGALAGWGLDMRDPTGDRRLIEFCLSVPEDQFLRDGMTKALVRRAFGDRLPQAMLTSRDKGLQSIDWHEGLVASQAALIEEIDRIGGCASAGDVLDLARMSQLARDLPESGWEQAEVAGIYRHGLLRGVSAGHFVRKAGGGND